MILLFSHSGFSDTEANGITMKNLLAAWQPEEKAEFYCNVSAPDFTAAHRCFRVTDMQMMKAFLGKKSQHIFEFSKDDAPKKGSTSKSSAKKIPGFLKKQKYNFGIKWLRETMWRFSPWGHRKLRKWIAQVDPDVLVYMVGESLFMDRKVLKTCKKTGVPLVLYHCEAYRIIDLKSRKGLERAYYRKTQKNYAKLNDRASLIIYNSQMLQDGFAAIYPPKAKAMIAYNSAKANFQTYTPKDTLRITYFGNLGVGRSESLLLTAKVLEQINPTQVLDIYGSADEETQERFNACGNIRFHGFLEQDRLHDVMEQSDILLHVESFEPEIAKKLKYAFSTKIAQCLCAGRCFVSFAPSSIASTQYLRSIAMPVATNEQELRAILSDVITNPQQRLSYARHALAMGLENHQKQAQQVRSEIGAILNEI